MSSGELARALGVTRQAIHSHLARMLRDGDVQRRGAGRGTLYSGTTTFRRRWRMGEADEDEVWRLVRAEVVCLTDLPAPADSILRYGVTEMVNNAIDHSLGSSFEVAVWCGDDDASIDVVDDGIGAFANVQRQRGLPDTFAAVQELSKGKVTTAPSHHSGEGIFFTSKAVDVFELESSGLRWIVDNLRGDEAVGESERHVGTRVRLELSRDTSRSLADVLGEYTNAETLVFDKTRTVVTLFQSGDSFVSRSEAKRLGTRLDQFTEIVVDFQGVREVGQGFVDELFRVWQRDHPEVRLLPVNMSPAVEHMVRRGLAKR